jgi:hypothetical protein
VSGSTVPAFRWCLLSRCLANDLIPSHYYLAIHSNEYDHAVFWILKVSFGFYVFFRSVLTLAILYYVDHLSQELTTRPRTMLA